MSASRWAPFGAALEPILAEQERICAMFEERLHTLRGQLRALETERAALLAPLHARALAITDAYDRGEEVPS